MHFFYESYNLHEREMQLAYASERITVHKNESFISSISYEKHKTNMGRARLYFL